MRRKRTYGATLGLWAAMTLVANGQQADKTGQTTEPSMQEVMKEFRSLTKRLETLEARHDKDQKRIQELEERLGRLEESPVPKEQAQEIEEIKSKIESSFGEAAPSSGLFGLSSSAFGTTNEQNPVTTVFADLGGSISSEGRDNALNRFNLREVELDLRAAISPSADGVMIITLGEDIQSDRRGDITVDRDVDIEEGYINFHSLPYDLALKVGKFRNLFGRNNLLHTHDLPQVTRPLAIQSFLGPEGIMTVGASLSWLVPNPWDKYLEATLEVVNADSGSDTPILGGPNAENPAVIGHLKFFDDITETSTFELGTSYLFTKTTGDADFDANVFGLDATYHWIDPDPSKFRSVLLQTELFWASNDVDRGPLRSNRNDSFGTYVFGQYQLNRNWYVGLRADYTEFPNSETRGSGDWDFALSPNVTWYLTEFLRARLEFQHRMFDEDDDTGSEEAVFLQFTAVIGAHPPHPYWVRR